MLNGQRSKSLSCSAMPAMWFRSFRLRTLRLSHLCWRNRNGFLNLCVTQFLITKTTKAHAVGIFPTAVLFRWLGRQRQMPVDLNRVSDFACPARARCPRDARLQAGLTNRFLIELAPWDNCPRLQLSVLPPYPTGRVARSIGSVARAENIFPQSTSPRLSPQRGEGERFEIIQSPRSKTRSASATST